MISILYIYMIMWPAARTQAGHKLHRAMLHCSHLAARTQAPLLRASRLSAQPRARRLASIAARTQAIQCCAHADSLQPRARRLASIAARTQAIQCCAHADSLQPRARRLASRLQSGRAHAGSQTAARTQAGYLYAFLI